MICTCFKEDNIDVFAFAGCSTFDAMEVCSYYLHMIDILERKESENDAEPANHNSIFSL
jgi:hypothetical protein